MRWSINAVKVRPDRSWVFKLAYLHYFCYMIWTIEVAIHSNTWLDPTIWFISKEDICPWVSCSRWFFAAQGSPRWVVLERSNAFSCVALDRDLANPTWY